MQVWRSGIFSFFFAYAVDLLCCCCVRACKRACTHRCQRSGLRSRFSLCTVLRWDLSCFSCPEHSLLIAYNRPMIPRLCLPASLRSVGVASVSHHIWLFVGLGAPTQVIRFMGQRLSLLNHFIRPMQMTLTLSQLWDPGLWKMRSAKATSLPMSYRAPRPHPPSCLWSYPRPRDPCHGHRSNIPGLC